MSKTFTVTRNDDASVSVTTSDALHTFRRPKIDEWVTFMDLISSNMTGTATLRLCKSIYGGSKSEIDRLVRDFPSLPTTVAGEIAEMLTAEAKKNKR